MKIDDKKITELVDAIKENGMGFETPLSRSIRQHVFLHFALIDVLENKGFSCDVDTAIKTLESELERTAFKLQQWDDQLNSVLLHLSHLTASLPDVDENTLTSISEICIHKINSLIPNGDTLGSTISV